MEHQSHHHEHTGPDETTRTLIRHGLIEHGHSIDADDAPALLLLNAIVQADCSQAHETGEPLPEDLGRGLAGIFACALPHGSSLQEFADGATPDYPRLWAEIGELRDLILRPRASEYLTWLTGHLIAAQYPELAPSRPPQPDTPGTHFITTDDALGLVLALHSPTSRDTRHTRDELFNAGLSLALNHGTAALAFLRIPTVDAADPELEDAFNRAHLGTFDTLEDMFDTFFHVIDAREEGNSRRILYEDLAPQEQAPLHAKLGSFYQLVEAGGQFHLFLRNP
ncbi:hypothetical protein [Arthrobacter woluwensis]|uniref:hypothetical protein n=1 Tax=Arthrobacter woluwensis TaxID=156980 RepID=UPI0011A48E61|nr:hypothetical protein [Arthrobacter woluwensis]